MNFTFKIAALSLGLVFLISACNRGPKVVEPVNTSNSNSSTNIFSDMPGHEAHDHEAQDSQDKVHSVTVEEILPAQKYVYLRVDEKGKKFWIATMKQEVEVGNTYVYQGNLLKTNFESKEYNRIFDTIYLVSQIVKLDEAGHSQSPVEATPAVEEKRSSSKKIEVEGSVKIADLVANPNKYAGKKIQISGECVKVNANIMGRNWLHFMDGSKDDYDLVVTSDLNVPIGHVVTMTATVTLNKDFGAGYKYDIILEDGEMVK